MLGISFHLTSISQTVTADEEISCSGTLPKFFAFFAFRGVFFSTPSFFFRSFVVSFFQLRVLLYVFFFVSIKKRFSSFFFPFYRLFFLSFFSRFVTSDERTTRLGSSSSIRAVAPQTGTIPDTGTCQQNQKNRRVYT